MVHWRPLVLGFAFTLAMLWLTAVVGVVFAWACTAVAFAAAGLGYRVLDTLDSRRP